MTKDGLFVFTFAFQPLRTMQIRQIKTIQINVRNLLSLNISTLRSLIRFGFMGVYFETTDVSSTNEMYISVQIC